MKLGIDIGSVTVKVVILSKENDLLFSEYTRHYGKQIQTLINVLENAYKIFENNSFSISITGSLGTEISKFLGLYYIQEVCAAAKIVKELYKDINAVIEIGGEDSKIIFLNKDGNTDMRMNGSCAGGTGSFIDQMADTLNITLKEMDLLAGKAAKIYPIASRCGVFAKTDVKSLLNTGASCSDISCSVFNAVARQFKSSLIQGTEINGKILFAGGPFKYLKELRESFKNALGVKQEEVILPEHPELLVAMGAALSCSKSKACLKLQILIENLKILKNKKIYNPKGLPPLFLNKNEYVEFRKRHSNHHTKKIDIKNLDDKDLQELNKKHFFLGIDAGSTTTKMVLIDNDGSIILKYYSSNNGNQIEILKKGFLKFNEIFKKKRVIPEIKRTAVTGYGEDLVKTAFGIDDCIVETMAHFKAAKKFEKNVSFILDIGGQDIKAIKLEHGIIRDIHLNEACSSGSGSFIESFAKNLSYDVKTFSKIALGAKNPVNLGTRCTVFMNSKVKQAMKEGVDIPNIFAGLSYSVINNALFKVIKLKNENELGKNIVVQGGTFLNDAILRAFELSSGKNVIRPEISELMGAYGAALIAADNYKLKNQKTDFIGFKNCLKIKYQSKVINCTGCENACLVTKLNFSNGTTYISGNRCDKLFSKNKIDIEKGENLFKIKNKLLFEKKIEINKKTKNIKIGIPRILNMYENFPFWNRFFTECGFEVILSSPSTEKLLEKGICSVMSDNICFPAKLSHGHINDLIEKKVDRIFFPSVVFEKKESKNAINTYNCPIVTGYSEVLKNTINLNNIPFDNPFISFKNIKNLQKALYNYMKQFGLSRKNIYKAVKKANGEYIEYRNTLCFEAKNILEKAKRQNRIVIVLAGRPYHIDQLINHGIPELLEDMGVSVITEDSICNLYDKSLNDINVLSQWKYHNRLYLAAKWVGETEGVEMVQLNSFGCGPDAITIDEVKDILESKGKIYTLLKIDEVTNLQGIRIRLRSLLEVIKIRKTGFLVNKKEEKNNFLNNEKGKKIKTILAPNFSSPFSNILPAMFEHEKYNLKIIEPNKNDIETGLKYVNNDICFPAIIIAGGIINALKSGKYEENNTIIGLTQTGGQCRASNYVPLLKKALISAGFLNVPVVSLSTDIAKFANDLEIKHMVKFIKKLAISILFGDTINRIFYSILPYEKIEGNSNRLYTFYINKMKEIIYLASFKELIKLIKKSVVDFNKIDINYSAKSKVGIVGEIYCKYNSFANLCIVDWLNKNNVEVVIPSMHNFFLQGYINKKFNYKNYIDCSFLKYVSFKILYLIINHYIKHIDKIMKQFKLYKRPHDLKELEKNTASIVSVGNQYGEGWLLTAEIIALAKDGVKNIVCIQPFGCISNHITGKGVLKKIKKLFPDINIVFIDMDAGASKVNIFNRLNLMLMRAKESEEG